jgi:hypothetical protein
MNRRQKIAWFQLALVGTAAVASIALMVSFVAKYEYSYPEAWWFGTSYSTPLLVLTVLAPLIIRKKKGQVDFDERDLMIDRQAAWIAFGASYAYFVGVCMTTLIAVGGDSPIPAHWLFRIVLGGWVTSIVGHAVTTLVQYGWTGKGGKASDSERRMS